MKNIYILAAFLIYISSIAQVGIGTTNIENGAALQIESTSKGLLIPRVALQSRNSEAPITPSPIVTGLLVYNTATAGAGGNAVIPGFYYWNGSLWVSITANSVGGTFWSLLGNSGTTPGTNYLGTSLCLLQMMNI